MSDERKTREMLVQEVELNDDFKLMLLRASLENEGVPIQLVPGEKTAIVPRFNAGRKQRATAFLPEDGKFQEWTGQGEDNNSAKPWVVSGYSEVYIRVEHERDGNWRDSLLKVKKRPMPSPDRTVRVLAEDGDDSDWNDTIVYIVPNPAL
jgi:hypothetical protein